MVSYWHFWDFYQHWFTSTICLCIIGPHRRFKSPPRVWGGLRLTQEADFHCERVLTSYPKSCTTPYTQRISSIKCSAIHFPNNIPEWSFQVLGHSTFCTKLNYTCLFIYVFNYESFSAPPWTCLVIRWRQDKGPLSASTATLQNLALKVTAPQIIQSHSFPYQSIEKMDVGVMVGWARAQVTFKAVLEKAAPYSRAKAIMFDQRLHDGWQAFVWLHFIAEFLNTGCLQENHNILIKNGNY